MSALVPGGRGPHCSGQRDSQAILCPDLDYGASCPRSLGAYLFAEACLVALILILCAT